MTREWMQSLCKRHSQLGLDRCFGLDWDGQHWDVACDGSAILLLSAASALSTTYPMLAREDTRDNVLSLLDKGRAPTVEHPARFGSLMEWADPSVELLTPPGITEDEPLIARFYDRLVNRRLIWKMLGRVWIEERDSEISVRLSPGAKGDVFIAAPTWRLLCAVCIPGRSEPHGRAFPLPNPDDMSMFEME